MSMNASVNQTFEEFEHRTSSGSEDNISSSVTTTSSLRKYGSRISINGSRRSSVRNSEVDSWSSNGGEDYDDEDDEDEDEDGEEGDDNESFKSFEGVHIRTPGEDEDGGSRTSYEADNDPLPSDTCEACQEPDVRVGVLSWCNICCIVLCDKCWIAQAAHRSNPRARGRKNHEKTDMRLWEIINSILNPETDSKRQEQLHRDNFDTKWFGVEFSENSRKPCFHDYGRYVKLASETEMEAGTQHPSITCFVGETGHGKSTLINALMKIHRHTTLAPDQVPVMGTSGELDEPTSDAVHLFADPITYNTNRPYFYADCEGLSGGTKIPMATRAYQGVKNFRQKRRHARNDPGDNGITWARGQEKSRQWMVENLYPRVLFTFSDVVCFVTRNFRTLENVISKLIRWADKVFQQSVNQPVLPYAVIVVNALEVSDIASPWWDIDGTTGDQLRKRADCIKDDPFMVKCVEKWRSLGKTINNLEELLMCYYSGIKIVCIPHAKESPAVIEQQYKVLYKVMEEGSQKAYDLRIKAGLLMTSEELDVYLRHAFHHFSKNPSKPFNFLAAAFHHNPVSSTFKDHIAKAAVHIMTQSPQMSGTDMFKLLAPLVASCILLDAFRSRYPHGGQAATIFPLYQKFCEDALAEVYEKHWRCEKRDKKGRRCANVATGHSKGHQMEDGKVFGVGDFSSAYIENSNKESDNFIRTISSELDSLLKEFSAGQGISVAQYHRDRVLNRYGRYWNWKGDTDHGDHDVAPLTAHTTCFSCLSGTPIHALTCGHIICERCAENYSTLPTSSFWREISICPLCSNMESPWEIPWKYKTRPKHTGLRILSLDGGGIRGIIQLKVLEALERKINLGVPIQDFFDLVVGTSSGGIIALALASKRVSVTECINFFSDFSEQAFQKRTGADLPVMKTLVEATYHSKYETRGIDRVLKEKFGDESIFGGKREPGGTEMLRAGVTTISSSGHPYLVANYNRPLTEDLKTKYNFLRAENSHQELKTWEAARATSAAPRFFKPFFHKPTGYSFNDGGLKFNNPVVVADQEWKLLWPNLANKHPDILLSIGTGYDPTPKPDLDKQGRRLRAKRGALEFAKVLLKIATQQIESSVGCEQTWSNFLRSLPMQDEDKAAKYHRLNVDLPNKLPTIDQVVMMANLKRAAEDFCFNNPLIDQISTKLIASLFYFRLDGSSRVAQGVLNKWDCEGTILCRLEPGSDALKRLCKRLETRRNGLPRRNHLFFMNERRNSRGTPDQQLIAEDSLFDNVTKGKPFEMKINFSMLGPEDSMRIFLSLSDKECDVSLISGFPCRILKEHDAYRPLARVDSARTQRGHKSKTPSFYSAVSVNSSASSLSGIFRGVITKAGTKSSSY